MKRNPKYLKFEQRQVKRLRRGCMSGTHCDYCADARLHSRLVADFNASDEIMDYDPMVRDEFDPLPQYWGDFVEDDGSRFDIEDYSLWALILEDWHDLEYDDYEYYMDEYDYNDFV